MNTKTNQHTGNAQQSKSLTDEQADFLDFLLSKFQHLIDGGFDSRWRNKLYKILIEKEYDNYDAQILNRYISNNRERLMEVWRKE